MMCIETKLKLLFIIIKFIINKFLCFLYINMCIHVLLLLLLNYDLLLLLLLFNIFIIIIF